MSAGRDESEGLLDQLLPRKVEYFEDVPPHVVTLGHALHNLEVLIRAHFLHLHAKHKGLDECADEESVYLRAGITLLCSAWEAYVEDLARNSLDFMIRECESPDKLPLVLRKHVSQHVKSNKHELSAWEMAGGGWKDVLRGRFDSIVQAGIDKLNTPSPKKIIELYSSTLGVDDITKSWTWDVWAPEGAAKILDWLIQLRCEFAHGRKATLPVSTFAYAYLRAVVNQCAFLMNNAMVHHLNGITGQEAWPLVRMNMDWDVFKKPEPKDATDDAKIPSHTGLASH